MMTTTTISATPLSRFSSAGYIVGIGAVATVFLLFLGVATTATMANPDQQPQEAIKGGARASHAAAAGYEYDTALHLVSRRGLAENAKKVRKALLAQGKITTQNEDLPVFDREEPNNEDCRTYTIQTGTGRKYTAIIMDNDEVQITAKN
jgi:hypothetical protein